MQRYKDLCMHSQLCMCWTMCLSLWRSSLDYCRFCTLHQSFSCVLVLTILVTLRFQMRFGLNFEKCMEDDQLFGCKVLGKRSITDYKKKHI